MKTLIMQANKISLKLQKLFTQHHSARADFTHSPSPKRVVAIKDH